MRDLIPPNEYRTNVMEQWQSRRCNSYDSFAIEMHLIKVIKIEWIRIYEENKCFFCSCTNSCADNCTPKKRLKFQKCCKCMVYTLTQGNVESGQGIRIQAPNLGISTTNRRIANSILVYADSLSSFCFVDHHRWLVQTRKPHPFREICVSVNRWDRCFK